MFFKVMFLCNAYASNDKVLACCVVVYLKGLRQF